MIFFSKDPTILCMEGWSEGRASCSSDDDEAIEQGWIGSDGEERASED